MKPDFFLPLTLTIQAPKILPNESGEWQLLLYPNRISSGRVTGDVDPTHMDFQYRFSTWLQNGIEDWELSLFRIPEAKSEFVSVSHLRFHEVNEQWEFHWTAWDHRFPLNDLPLIGQRR